MPFHITVTFEPDLDDMPHPTTAAGLVAAAKEILSFRTANRPNIPALISLLEKPPRAPRSDKGKTRGGVA